jgi:hypothetical protein
MDICTPGKGGLAAELLSLAFNSLAAKRFTQILFAPVIEEADVADIRDPQSLMDLAKSYFRSLSDCGSERYALMINMMIKITFI